MQVVWEADTAAFASRKRAARACLACQKKKKRCNHTFTRPPDQRAESDGVDRVLPNLTHKEPIRFIGDLNPESILTDLGRNKDTPRASRIGQWVQEAPPEDGQLRVPSQEPPTSRSGEKTPINVEKYGRGEGGKRTLTTHYRNYLQSVGAFRVLPKATQDALVTTYIACFDGLLSIVDGGKLLRDYISGNTSIFLIQAICLVTCKVPDAQQWLRLYEDGPLLEPIPFARSLHTGLDAAMKADLEPDRVTKIQILALMHLHNDGPGGIEESSLHLSQAIHDAWTAGLHIHTPGRTLTDHPSMLWWTIWALDRFNACIGGRPIMIADRDIDLSRPPLDAEMRKNACVLVWIRLADLLDKVIEFYRPPSADLDVSGWESEFPTWDSLLQDIDLGENTTQQQCIVLEIAYNVITILSCRNASPLQPSYTRRIAGADRIEALLTEIAPRDVPPIPLVPYAIGLSLTVAYRGIRSPSTTNPEKVKESLNTRSKMLESLATYWWTADAMAKLGRKALKSMQNPVGIKRGEAENLASAMESETTPCKYGPFESKPDRPNSTPAGRPNGTGPGALHLLSDAAVARSQTPRNTSDYSAAPAGTTGTSICMEGSQGPSTNTDTSFQQTPLTDPLPTPGDHHRASAPPGAMNAPTPAFDPSMFAKFDDESFTSNFNELDNMFDGFYDLSMPTVTFQDFDGWGGQMGFGDADYGSGGTGGGYDTVMGGQPGVMGGGSVYPDLG